MTLTMTPRSALPVVLVLAGSLLGGCSSSDEGATASTAGTPPTATTTAPGVEATDAETGTETETPVAPDEASSAAADDFPGCDEVKAALGAPVDGLIELDDSENGVSTGADGPSLVCGWYTPETDGSSIDVTRYGFISIGVSRDPEYTEESMEPLGWTVEDPGVSAAGAWALKVGGGYDPAAQLDATGVQVVRDGVVVVLTSSGVALQDVPGLASATNEWALGAGLAVLELMG